MLALIVVNLVTGLMNAIDLKIKEGAETDIIEVETEEEVEIYLEKYLEKEVGKEIYMSQLLILMISF